MRCEDLRVWCIELSEMIGGELDDESTLEEGLTWFGELSEETLDQVNRLGRDNSALRDFLALGRELMAEVSGAE